MFRINALVKVSGDVFANPGFIQWVGKLARARHVVICVGGGTQIKEEYTRLGWDANNFGPMGRETKTPEEREVADTVLRSNQANLKQVLGLSKINASVVVPSLYIAGVCCPVNGDQYVLTCYLGFDELYVATLPERLERKREQFAKYPKIKVQAF